MSQEIKFHVIESPTFEISKEELMPNMGPIACFKCEGIEGVRYHICGKDGENPYLEICSVCKEEKFPIPVSSCNFDQEPYVCGCNRKRTP